VTDEGYGHLSIVRGNVLFARGSDKRLSRGNQGWAILSLSLKVIIRRGEGKEGSILYPADLERGKERRLAKITFLSATLSCNRFPKKSVCRFVTY